MDSLPNGFRYAGVSCGIKTKPNTKDVALIVSDQPCVGAGVYTTNQVVAAPVVLSRSRTPSDSMRAIVVNSGNANACTGTRGMDDAKKMTELAAKALGIDDAENVLVMSTGVIGRFLPMEKIEKGIADAAQKLGTTMSHFHDAVDGISTTDAFRKLTTRHVDLGSHGQYSIAGMAKGAGMIGPKMATMLGIVVTDAPLTQDQAKHLLQYAVDRSFNCISVEGHMSTNDTVVLLSSGIGLGKAPLNAEGEKAFGAQLESMCIQLAKQIPEDGEGATHLIEIQVEGAASQSDADTIARSVALSNLVKTAITGGDPNWGRIVSAVGYAGVPIETEHLALKLNGFDLFDRGEPLAFDAKAVSLAIKEKKDTLIQLKVGSGPGKASHWTTDLNCEYVRFNSEYTT